MKLKQWLTAHGVQQGEFARLVGINPSRISHICNGGNDGKGRFHGRPSHKLALKILRATGGAVTPADMGVLLSEETVALVHAVEAAWTPEDIYESAPAAAPLPTRESEDAG